VGVFSLEGKTAEAAVDAKDGTYTNLLSGEAVTVKNGMMLCSGEPIIFKK